MDFKAQLNITHFWTCFLIYQTMLLVYKTNGPSKSHLNSKSGRVSRSWETQPDFLLFAHFFPGPRPESPGASAEQRVIGQFLPKESNMALKDHHDLVPAYPYHHISLGFSSIHLINLDKLDYLFFSKYALCFFCFQLLFTLFSPLEYFHESKSYSSFKVHSVPISSKKSSNTFFFLFC